MKEKAKSVIAVWNRETKSWRCRGIVEQGVSIFASGTHPSEGLRRAWW